MTARLPSLFIPHGGGPCFFMDPEGGPADPMWQPMQAYLAGLIDSLPARPKAILLISGHWEEDQVTVHEAASRCSTIMAVFPSIPIGCAGTRRVIPTWPRGRGRY